VYLLHRTTRPGQLHPFPPNSLVWSPPALWLPVLLAALVAVSPLPPQHEGAPAQTHLCVHVRARVCVLTVVAYQWFALFTAHICPSKFVLWPEHLASTYQGGYLPGHLLLHVNGAVEGL